MDHGLEKTSAACSTPGGRGAIVFSIVDQPAKSDEKSRGQPGCILPGQLTGILGPAASGKANFLRVLAGQQAVSGHTACVALTARSGEAALVDAYDALVPNLTVEAQLLYAAELSAGLRVPAAGRVGRVAEALRLLRLEPQRAARIGNAWLPGITATEARLASIGMALVSAPTALCVDDPTGGLPAASGNAVVAALKRIASEKGIAVVAALDAPTSASYALLDRVLVLLQGRTAYFGTPGAALATHFETHCPQLPALGAGHLPESEWLLEALSQPGCSAAPDAYSGSTAASAASQEVEEQMDHIHGREDCRSSGAPAWFGLWTLFRRRTLTNFTDPVWVAMRFAIPLCFCLVIMSLYWKRADPARFMSPASVGNIVSILWMFVLLPAYAPVILTGLTVMDMPVFLSPHWIRDRRAGWYSSSVYFVHKVSEEAAIIVLMTLPLSCILFFPLELHGDWSLFWLVQVTTTSIGTLLVYTLSALTPTVEAAVGTANTFLTLLLFFAGLLIRTVDIPGWWHWFSYLDFMRYSFGALIVNEYGGRFGWDATLLIYNLQAVNKWQYLGYQVTFVAGLLAALWAALFFKQHAPQYRVSIALRRR